MKKRVAVGWVPGGIVIAIFVFIAIFYMNQKATEPPSIKIGAVLPLTGSFGYFGQGARDGLLLATENSNAKGILKFDLLLEDSKSAAKDGVSAAQKLLSVNSVKYLITQLSHVTEAVQPITEAQGVILVATTVMDTDVTQRGKRTLRIYYNMNQESEFMIKLLKHLEAKRVASIYVNTANISKQFEQLLDPQVRAMGAEFVARESFSFNDKDVRNQVDKILQSNPDFILVLSYPNYLPMVFRAMSERKAFSKTRVLVNLGLAYHVDFPIDQLEGVYFVAPSYLFKSESEEDVPFIHQFRDRYGRLPNFDEAFAYDTFMILAKGIEDSQGKEEQVWSRLINRSFQGVSGRIQITDNGDCNVDVSIGIVKRGKKVIYEFK